VKSIVMAGGSANGRPLLRRTITGRKSGGGMMLESARKSSDAHTWGFENGVVMTALSSGCRAIRATFTAAGSFLFHGFSRPPFPPLLAHFASPTPPHSPWPEQSQLLVTKNTFDGEVLSDVVLDVHNLLNTETLLPLCHSAIMQNLLHCYIRACVASQKYATSSKIARRSKSSI
jgi:hypothetical protein